MNPFILTDAYKISHPRQYPPKTEFVYSNITARKSRMPWTDSVVAFGMQYFVMKWLKEYFDTHFFGQPKNKVIGELRDFLKSYLGETDVSIYEKLHDLGYLPLKVKALPEGTSCPMRVPFMTIENTHPDFYWLTNFIETLSQTVLWNLVTSATIARQYHTVLSSYAAKTAGEEGLAFVPFQGHNFSMRGMSSVESGITADMGHLLYFVGSDTLPGNYEMRKYYVEDQNMLVSCSVPATEHAVMCAGGKDNEVETFRRLIEDVYPSGIVSIVSDTWNLWDVFTEILPELKDKIEARDGKVVIRPDSGDPVKIICGYRVALSTYSYETIMDWRPVTYVRTYFENAEYDAVMTCDGIYLDVNRDLVEPRAIRGAMRLLADEFGATANAQGYKVLNPKVGLIYGDSITLERAQHICARLVELGFASTNIVFGIGSYTYQYNTRDTFSIACKATWVQVDGEAKDIFKDPVTDDGTKKSAYGRLAVLKDGDGELYCVDQADKIDEADSLLRVIFEDGDVFTYEQNLETIRNVARKLS